MLPLFPCSILYWVFTLITSPVGLGQPSQTYWPAVNVSGLRDRLGMLECWECKRPRSDPLLPELFDGHSELSQQGHCYWSLGAEKIAEALLKAIVLTLI